jgi:ribonuclease Z
LLGVSPAAPTKSHLATTPLQILHEFTPRAVPAEQSGAPVEVLRRSRLYAVQLPPDALNPEGYYDGELSAMLARHTRKRSGGGADLRAAVVPLPLPPPGDPSLRGLGVADMAWTVRADAQWSVTAVPLRGRGPCLGYVIKEADKHGRLFPEVACALGVVDRDQYTVLKGGAAVETPEGVVVRAEQCVGPPRPGRRVAIVPPCLDSQVLASRGGEVDVLIHAMLPPYAAGDWAADVSVARGAGRTAAALGAKELVLWQTTTAFLDTPQAAEPEWPLRALGEAREAFGDEHVSLGGSHHLHSWRGDDRGGAPPEVPEHLRAAVEASLEQRGGGGAKGLGSR